jgi:hypothetical protein
MPIWDEFGDISGDMLPLVEERSATWASRKTSTAKKPVDPIYAQMDAISRKTGCKVERDPHDPHVLVVDKPYGPPEHIAVFRTKEEAEEWVSKNVAGWETP